MTNRDPLLVREPPEPTALAKELNSAASRRACLLLGGILAACGASLGLACLCSLKFPLVISHSLLAFGLGLRHAVDCDHLAAIDNVTRQLINRGQRPVSVGFWFAMGHSTVVVVMTAVLAGGYNMAWRHFNKETSLTDDVSFIAALLSVGLLSGIGLLNAKIACSLFKRWTGLNKLNAEDQEEELAQMAQESMSSAITSLPWLRSAFNGVDKPSKMYGVGLLFGLSFDTATQVALIGLAAITGTSQRFPPWMVMIFPLCFSCGMCLVDTANGLLMLMTYSWATIKPMQKLLYNFVVTALSSTVALAVGGLELLQIIAKSLKLKGPFWSAIQNVDMASLGYTVMGTFLAALLIAVVTARCRRADASEVPNRNEAP